MAKGPFHFKRFSVQQDGAAMKVGTDGIVLGCWTPIEKATRILDAGAGNGYVGIMLLQRMTSEARLTGVELEPTAAEQCAENYRNQPFSGRAEAWEGSLQEAAKRPDWSEKFDLIISNPPFFRDKPKSPIRARNLARHDDTLPMGALVKAASKLLTPGGRLCTIWPADREAEWNAWAEGSGFVLGQTVRVQTMRHLPPKRFLSEWVKSNEPTGHQIDQLTLEGNATLDYTEQYLSLVRPYLRGT